MIKKILHSLKIRLNYYQNILNLMVESKKKAKINTNFLSLQILDSTEYLNTAINEFIPYKSNNDLSELINYESKYKLPKDFHVTTYFGGKTKDKNNQAIIEFELNKKVDVNILGYVLVKDRIFFSIIRTEAFVNNPVPHITTLLGSYLPKNSNDVGEALFIHGDLKEDYTYLFNKIDFQEKKSILKELKIQLFGKEEIAYILILNPKNVVSFEAKMTA